MMAEVSPRFSAVLEPVTGLAVPLYRGETLRITLLEGPQCVDFNAFNLSYHKEHMSQSWTRILNPSPGLGATVISRPPHFRPMLRVTSIAPGCFIDLIGPGCHKALWQRRYGFDTHPNCQDTLAVSIGEYGLTPEDVHDSMNMWYQTETQGEPWNPYGSRLNAKKGDYIEFESLMDLLVVPAICGGADMQASAGNYWPKPVGVEIYSAMTAHETAVAASPEKPQSSTYSLVRNPDYVPEFVDYPVSIHSVTVEVSSDEYRQINRLVGEGLADDAEDFVRSSVMEWYNQHRARLDPAIHLNPSSHS